MSEQNAATKDTVDAAARPTLWLGLDTGGTFTDAVVLENGQRIVTSAKALTTHWDLAIGIGGAIRAVLAALPVGARREDVRLVSVSTTLATNAVVEDRFSPICTLLIGFDEPMLERSGLKRHGSGFTVRIDGGHDATGEESEPLDVVAIESAVREYGPRVAAFAIAARFSVRNPGHELQARHLIRRLSHHPVTCAHELSSRLDAPRRALTAALNARLTPQISHLLTALAQVLKAESVDAPLMIVKGDGSLMRADVALECPVETILSGPAASVVGAGFLTGLKDFIVSDIGGTTTDVAVVANGRPVVNAEGALIGGWRTMVDAVDVRTCGLGGDSEVVIDREGHLKVGPRKAMSLSLLAHQVPEVLEQLRLVTLLEPAPDYPGQFAFRNPGREAPGHLTALEKRTWDALGLAPKRASEVIRNSAGLHALRRLADAGLATIAAFTPSDAMHVLNRQSGWNVEAARIGASLLAIQERNATAARSAVPAETICERTIEHVIRESGRIVLATALAHDPSVEASSGRSNTLGDRLLEDVICGRPFSKLVTARLGLAVPLVAIGAPAGGYYPEVARRLGATLAIPEYAAVCNAVGAVAGVVAQAAEVVVNQPTFRVFRVHDPAGFKDYSEPEEAIEHARRASRALALASAHRAGADHPEVETVVLERRALVGASTDYLAEATVRSTATGRPLAGRA